MAKKITPAITLGIVTILAILFLTGFGSDDKQILRETFDVDAVYYDSGYVEVSYIDHSEKTNSVTLEILGMKESFQKSFYTTEFIEIVPLPTVSKYGWEVHPVVLEIDHIELGKVQLKTEIHSLGESAPPTIYSRP